jgi:hypothetical protein
VWTGVGGAPYYTNLYAVGPASTNNGNDLADAWHAFLGAIGPSLTSGLTATIDPEILEFNETNGVVVGAGNTIQTPVNVTGLGDRLPPQTQALIQWTTNGIVHNRRVKGRTFIPGVREADNSATGTPVVGPGTPIQTAIDTLLSAMSGRMRIWSRPFPGDPAKPSNPERLGSAWPIMSGKVAPYWATLRSRRD